MNTIDDKLLEHYGINIPSEDKENFYNQLNARLEELVGLAIIDKLGDDDAKELMELSKIDNEQAVTDWLASKVPDFEEVVKQELDTLLTEVAASQSEQTT